CAGEWNGVGSVSCRTQVDGGHIGSRFLCRMRRGGEKMWTLPALLCASGGTPGRPAKDGKRPPGEFFPSSRRSCANLSFLPLPFCRLATLSRSCAKITTSLQPCSFVKPTTGNGVMDASISPDRNTPRGYDSS